MFYSTMCFLEKPILREPPGNPCNPSPCGPFSQCRAIGETPACSCLPNYIGRAPNCRPECSINAECPGNLACINEKCKDICPGSCGMNANCMIIKHSPVCTCINGYTGDPFSGCYLTPSKIENFLRINFFESIVVKNIFKFSYYRITNIL